MTHHFALDEFEAAYDVFARRRDRRAEGRVAPRVTWTSFVGRSLVSGDEVVDRLLDLRNALVSAMSLPELAVQ